MLTSASCAAARYALRRAMLSMVAPEATTRASRSGSTSASGTDSGNALLQIAVAPGFPVFDQRNPVGGFGNLYCRNFVDPARQADSNRVEIDRL